MSKLLIEQFIEDHPNDWEVLLKKPPYCLKIFHEGDYTLFKYNHYDSIMREPIVQEARGLIINMKTKKVVCHSFNKFFNYDDSNSKPIDWNSAKVLDKIDGTLVNLWWDNNEWHWSTNGNIDAFKGTTNIKADTFGNCIIRAITNEELTYDEFLSYFKPAYTYMFELVTPANILVTKANKDKLYYLSCRNMITGKEEIKTVLPVIAPKQYHFNNIKEVVKAANKFDDQHEGYVVVDNNYNRVKVKGKEFLKSFYINNFQLSKHQLMDILLQKEVYDEFIKTFPQYIPALKDLEDKWNAINLEIKRASDELKRIESESPSVTRKQFFENVNKIQTVDFVKSYLLLDEESQENYRERMRTNVYLDLNLIKKYNEYLVRKKMI